MAGMFCGLVVFAAARVYAQTQVVAPVEHVDFNSLSAAQRRVGFDGTKEEDLNKAPLFARPRTCRPSRRLTQESSNPRSRVEERRTADDC